MSTTHKLYKTDNYKLINCKYKKISSLYHFNQCLEIYFSTLLRQKRKDIRLRQSVSYMNCENIEIKAIDYLIVDVLCVYPVL